MNGLLSTFDGAMSGLTPDAVTALPEPVPAGDAAQGEPPRSNAHDAGAPATELEPHDTVDPRAREVAARLLGTGVGPAAAPVTPGPSVRLVAAIGNADVALQPGHGVVIGRADGDLVVALGVVSRRHCRVDTDGARITVIDLGSANGTLVERAGGERVRVANAPVELCAGDTIATVRGLRPIARLEQSEGAA